MFLPNSKNQTNNHFKTLNNKTINKLLTTNNIYNKNIKKFKNTTKKLNKNTIKNYDQILNKKTTNITITTTSILLTKHSNINTYTKINNYLNKLKNQQKLLNNINIIKIIYIKKPSKNLTNLQKKFNKTIKKNFLIKLTKTSKTSKKFNTKNLLKIKKNNVPLNYNIHHKLSLNNNNTNNFKNLILIKNKPYHKIFTNIQSQITKKILINKNKITP